MQQTELVALRIGQDGEAFVAGLSDIGPAGSERQQPSHLGLYITAIDDQVGVVTVLTRLGRRGRLQPDAEAVTGWSEVRVAVVARLDLIAQHRRPESRRTIHVPYIQRPLFESADHVTCICRISCR